MSEHPTAQLRRLFRIVNGGTPTVDESNWGGDVRWATPVDLGGVDGGDLVSTDRTLTARGLQTGSRLVPPGSLIVSTRAPVGYVASVGQPTAFNQGCKGLVPTIDLDVRFHRYQMFSLKARLAAESQGSTFVELSNERLAQIPLRSPPIEEQRRIADHLDAETARIDALIAKRQRQIELLEERISAKLSADVDGLSEWQPLRYMVRFREGPGIMAVDFRDEGVPLLRLRNLVAGRVDLEGCGHLDPDAVAARWSQFRVRMDDVLISGSASLGGSAVVDDAAAVGAIPYTGLIILRPTSERVWLPFVRGFLRSSSFKDQITKLKTGATMEHFGPTHLSSVTAPCPPIAEQRDLADGWERSAEQVRHVGASLDRQIELLRERRQALITAMVTGTVSPP